MTRGVKPKNVLVKGGDVNLTLLTLSPAWLLTGGLTLVCRVIGSDERDERDGWGREKETPVCIVQEAGSPRTGAILGIQLVGSNW